MQTGTSRPGYIAALVLLSAASGAGCGKVTLDDPAEAVDAQVLVDAAGPGTPDARIGADAQGVPDARAVPDAALPRDAGVPCADGELQRRDPVTGACYMLFSTTPLDWIAARDTCEALDPPAHLITVTSAEEHALSIELAGTTNLWLGASDRALEGDFVWVTGEPMDFVAWDDGEPNNGAPDGNPENCAILLVDDQTRPNTWDDRTCGSLRAYVCERE